MKSYLYEYPVEKFSDVQEAWFWFCFCESAPQQRHRSDKKNVRPCETSDIAIVLKRLVREKKLSQMHLKILSRFGLQQVPPHRSFGDSVQVCTLWHQALNRLETPLFLKGIIERTGF